MRFLLVLLVAALAAHAADPWKKVQELKSGAELRIFKTGSRQPLTATLDEVFEDRISVATKKEQISIAKEDIDRLDARPAGASRSVTRESTTTQDPAYNPRPGEPRRPGERPGPSGSSSSGVTIGGKPDFETVYRRTPTLAPSAK